MFVYMANMCTDLLIWMRTVFIASLLYTSVIGPKGNCLFDRRHQRGHISPIRWGLQLFWPHRQRPLWGAWWQHHCGKISRGTSLRPACPFLFPPPNQHSHKLLLSSSKEHHNKNFCEVMKVNFYIFAKTLLFAEVWPTLLAGNPLSCIFSSLLLHLQFISKVKLV